MGWCSPSSALDQQGVKPKPRQLADDQSKAAERYTIGPLAHMLKNQLYVGEVDCSKRDMTCYMSR